MCAKIFQCLCSISGVHPDTHGTVIENALLKHYCFMVHSKIPSAPAFLGIPIFVDLVVLLQPERFPRISAQKKGTILTFISKDV